MPFAAAIVFGFTTLNAAAEEKTADEAAELAKKMSNPIAALISVPIKFDMDTDIGTADADRSTNTIQPVIPFELNDRGERDC